MSTIAFTPSTEHPAQLRAGVNLPGFKRLNAHVVIFGAASMLALATASECRSLWHLPSLLYGALLWLWWAPVASALWSAGRRSRSSGLSAKTVSLHLLVGSALGCAHLLLLGALGFTVAGWRAHATALSTLTSELNLNRFGMEMLLYGFLFGITGSLRAQFQSQQTAIRSLALEKELSAAHLRALQAQMQPHFLFNTLNAITTLVELGRPTKASVMLGHLNVILKSTLEQGTPEKIPLSRELEVVENYLAIEQVRFADRLRVKLQVEPAVLDSLLPCFLLQPIVENAIRHGIAHAESDGVVEASARRDGSMLLLRVHNTGCGTAPKRGLGIGLGNTRERLAHFYDGAYTMDAGPLASGGFEVRIAIPFELA